MYVFTHGSKFRKFTTAILEIGAKVIKSEVRIVNQATIGLDLILFGESVPITDGCDLIVFKNETVSSISEMVENFEAVDKKMLINRIILILTEKKYF